MGFCCSVFKKEVSQNIMLSGLNLSGKTYYLYKHLKNLIGAQTKIKTKSTMSFNWEKVDIMGQNINIIDLPGEENMRTFWPLFYRNINFSGVIYIINYQHKETFMDSVKLLHELLNDYELIKINLMVLVHVNFEENESNVETNQEEFKLKNDKIKKITELENQLQKETYFHLLPQHLKQLRVHDIFDENITQDQVNEIRNILNSFVKNF